MVVGWTVVCSLLSSWLLSSWLLSSWLLSSSRWSLDIVNRTFEHWAVEAGRNAVFSKLLKLLSIAHPSAAHANSGHFTRSELDDRCPSSKECAARSLGRSSFASFAGLSRLVDDEFRITWFCTVLWHLAAYASIRFTSAVASILLSLSSDDRNVADWGS